MITSQVKALERIKNLFFLINSLTSVFRCLSHIMDMFRTAEIGFNKTYVDYMLAILL